MSIFDTPNPDAQSSDPHDVATGARVGFLENWSRSYDAQVQASSQFGIEQHMYQSEWEQVEALRGAGEENIQSLAPDAIGYFKSYMPTPGQFAAEAPYLDTAKFYEDGGDQAQAARLQKYDTYIEELKKKYPGLKLKNSREMWEGVKQRAQDSERLMAKTRTTVGGDVGGFAGGAVAALNPTYDPTNFLFAPVGGAAKTVAGRIGLQGTVQGATETFNQLTGVQTQRRLLGLSHGFTDALPRIVGAAAGGAALQGLGEGLVAGGKRWFRNTPKDPAPPPFAEPPPGPQAGRPGGPQGPVDPFAAPTAEARLQAQVQDIMKGRFDYTNALHELSPYGESRMGKARTKMDMDYVASRLESWEGEAPINLRPRGMTAVPEPVSRVHRQDFITTAYKSLDDTAREVDPKTFAMYDKLANEKAMLRDAIEKSRPDSVEAQRKIDSLSDKIDRLKDNMYAIQKRDARASAKKKLDTMIAERDTLAAAIKGKDTPQMAALRDRMMQADYKMRDLAPHVTRAYTQAKGEFSANQSMRDRINNMISEGGTKLPPEARVKAAPEETVGFVRKTLVDDAPILQQASRVEAKMRENADGIDYANAIVKEALDLMDDRLKTFREGISKQLGDEKAKTVTIDGNEHKLSDVIEVDSLDGEGTRRITIRQLLEEQLDAEENAKVTTKCSI